MRDLQLFADEQLLMHKQFRNSENQQPNLEMRLDGIPVWTFSVGSPKHIQEPQQIGAQVEAMVEGRRYMQTCTKIAPGQWIYMAPGDRYNPSGTPISAGWSNMAVVKILNPPEPEPREELEEPIGMGAIVRTDCHLGRCAREYGDDNDSYFVKIRPDMWNCQVCDADYEWKELIDGSPQVDIVREGLKV